MKRNKRLFFIGTILMLLILSILVIVGSAPTKNGKAVYYCPMHPTYISDRPGDCPICNMKLVKKEPSPHETHPVTIQNKEEKQPQDICLEHNCTMNNCGMKIKIAMKPGEKILCPVCGEYLVSESGKLVEIQPEDAKTTTVMISPQRQQLIGIKLEAVKPLHLVKTIHASGKIAYDPELLVTQEEFIQALKNEENVKDSPLRDVIDRARSLREAAGQKLRLLGMSESEISELEKTRRADTSLYLPKEGENVWAYISVYEYEIGLVRPDASVEIDTPAYPGEIFLGTVKSINPVLDATTRTNQVRVEVANPENKLKPEMFANARIKVDLGEKLAVPQTAILDTGMRKIVYLSKPGDTLEGRSVRLGQKAEGYYEVLEGLEEGDIVVTSGNFLIDSESRLKSALGSDEHKH